MKSIRPDLVTRSDQVTRPDQVSRPRPCPWLGSRCIRLTTLAVGVMLTGCGAGQADELDVVRGFLELHARGHAAGASQFFAPDGRLEGPEHGLLEGGAAINGRMAWDSVLSIRFTTSGELSKRGDGVVLGPLTRSGEDLRLMGIELLEYEAGTRFDILDEEIRLLTFSPLTAASEAALNAALAAFEPWALHEYRERWARIRPAGRFEYEGRRAADLLSLLGEWSTHER